MDAVPSTMPGTGASTLAVRTPSLRRVGHHHLGGEHLPAHLDDVFMTYTGRTIRDAEASSSERMAVMAFSRAE